MITAMHILLQHMAKPYGCFDELNWRVRVWAVTFVLSMYADAIIFLS